MKIKRVEVQAFRAYLEKVNGTFDFMVSDQSGGEVPANFVSLYAPNGFGKSSFYDAVEWAMTNGSERFKGGYYEMAARGSKLEGEALRVLRNTEAPAGIETSVLVSTTVENFERKPGVIRRNSIDVDFKGKKLDDGAEAYQRIFLSQEAIDHFIRGISPEDRYQTFVDVYGEETEFLRRQVQEAYLDVGISIQKSKIKEDALTAEIDGPVDNFLVDSFVTTARELKASGIQLLSLKEVVAETDIDELTEELLRLNSKVHDELNAIAQKELALHELVEGLASNSSDVDELNKAVNAERNILAALDNIGKLGALSKVKSECLTECIRRADELHRNELILNRSELFFRLHKRRQKLVSEKGELNVGLKEADVKSEGLLYLKRDLQKRFDDLQDKKASWKILKNGAANIYRNIKQSTSEQEVLDDEFRNASSDLAQLSAKLIEHQRVLSVISGLPKNALELSAVDSALLGIDAKFFADLRSTTAHILVVEEKLASLDLLMLDLQAQSNSFERLAALGSEILSSHPGHNCPLCRKDHGTYAALQEAIENNQSLKIFLKEKLSQRSIEANKLRELEQRVLDGNSVFLRLKEQRIKLLEHEVGKLTEAELAAKQALTLLEAKLQSIKEKLVSYTSIVLNLEPGELSLRVEDELNIFSERIDDCQKEMILTSHKLDLLQQEKQAKISKITDLDLHLSKIEADPDYYIVRSYFQEYECDPSEGEASLNSLNSKFKLVAEESSVRLSDVEKHMRQVAEAIDLSGFKNDEGLVGNELKQCATRLSELRTRVAAYNSRFSSLVGVSPFEHPEYEALLSEAIREISSLKETSNACLAQLNSLSSLFESVKPLISREFAKAALNSSVLERAEYEVLKRKIGVELKLINESLERQFDSIFQTDLINEIYRKIDPHPNFKQIKFSCALGLQNRPTLNIVIKDKGSEKAISPLLYFSSAQLNILSLSIFLARALNAKSPTGESLDLILIDDPIHSMDSINILSTIDLLRGISINHNKQIIISTHDENFYELLKRKIPKELCRSKFLKLESFGRVVVDN
ncbi:AAA family ATPase [Pseudomonas bubulae]|uniref:AAA family ATPase n=1 Tax=Pseudomonas bubulae TaxID=2316085 RepID=UPI002B1E84AD|nr:hypothetical protein [Pseudomonas bubulae]